MNIDSFRGDPARGCGLGVGPCHARGEKTGPDPVDRRKMGSKHHLLVGGNGRAAMAVTLTGANRHDVTQLLPLVDAVPGVRGKRGRPRRRFRIVQGDRAYDSQPHRRQLRARGSRPLLVRRNPPHGSDLGVHRWVVERAELAAPKPASEVPLRPARRHPRGVPGRGLRVDLFQLAPRPILLGALSRFRSPYLVSPLRGPRGRV